MQGRLDDVAAAQKETSMARIQRVLVSLIIRSGASVLLLQRGQPYSEFLRHDPDTQVGIDLWELPGGGLDFGETPLRAAVRETSEETGISVKEGNLKLVACCAYTLKGSGCESHRAHIIYEADVGAASDVKHSKEHAAHQWVQDKGALQALPMVAEVRDVIIANL
jgi:8-oxo-dGTP pyrophosphatase MutT (NUDIX family)